MFELGEHLLDGIDVGAVGRQKPESCAGRADCGFGAGSLVAGRIAENQDVPSLQGRRQHFLDIGAERAAVDRAA